MNKVTTIGIDLAKHVFQVASFDSQNRLLSNKVYTRVKMVNLLSNLPPCIIGMEACGTAHFFANLCTSMGHTVKLLPPVLSKAFSMAISTTAMTPKRLALLACSPKHLSFIPKQNSNYDFKPYCVFVSDGCNNVQRLVIKFEAFSLNTAS